MSILDHNDHVKAGRAVIIVSVMHIFLSQCIVEFSDVTLLGLKVRISSQELLSLVRLLLYGYAFLFGIRLFQSGILFRFLAVANENEKLRDEQVRLLDERMLSSMREMEARKSAFFESLSNTDPNHDEVFAAGKDKFREEGDAIHRIQERGIKRAEAYASAKTYIDYAVSILIEVVVPLSFLFMAVFARVDWLVCSAQAQALPDATSLLVH
ncbi:hypothetical protein [Ruegeria sp. SCP11]|uniref:hypothetical protein n=1 Tax=Ruegeria sp. SCP11 TaxID=3141378 RepID=UPI00333B30C3